MPRSKRINQTDSYYTNGIPLSVPETLRNYYYDFKLLYDFKASFKVNNKSMWAKTEKETAENSKLAILLTRKTQTQRFDISPLFVETRIMTRMPAEKNVDTNTFNVFDFFGHGSI